MLHRPFGIYYVFLPSLGSPRVWSKSTPCSFERLPRCSPDLGFIPAQGLLYSPSRPKSQASVRPLSRVSVFKSFVRGANRETSVQVRVWSPTELPPRFGLYIYQFFLNQVENHVDLVRSTIFYTVHYTLLNVQKFINILYSSRYSFSLELARLEPRCPSLP